jgi:predicted SAM-dependent methyltransferase
MPQNSLAQVGATLRRVPGARFPLDARLAVRRRRARRAAERREAALVERDRAWVASLAGRRDLRLNIGSSGEHVEGWINADLLRDPEGRCLRMDATERWPFEDGSAEAVNSEHVIEHVNPSDAPKFFREAFRVLQPGGVIRTSTPDLRGITEAYLEADPAVLDAHRSHGYAARNHADLVNNYVHMHGHVHIYDFETLAALLAEAGFGEAERVEFGMSRHQLLHGIDRHDAGELRRLVVCVDAVKPSEPAGARESVGSLDESRA